MAEVKTPLTASQWTALKRLLFVLMVLAILGWALFVTGCGAVDSARRLVTAQTPGQVTGAGATLTGPGNSATPTTQTAERLIAFQMPTVAIPGPFVPEVEVRPPQPAGGPQILPAPRPAWIQEKVTTTLGQHQDAAGIVKMAATMSSWPMTRWLGLLAIVVGIGGLLHAAGNSEGYPLCWVKTVIIGLVLMIVDNPWWLLLGLIPLAFYVAQKLNLLRV